MKTDPFVVNLRRRRLTTGALCGLAGAAALATSACTLAPDRDHTGAAAPSAGTLAGPHKVAWVLSSGGPRGFVHLGVLKALDELGLRPDLVVGASAGALVGTLYAAGLPMHELEALALDLQPWSLGRLAVTGTERLSGAALADFVRERLQGRPLEQLPVPMVCVAQRLTDGAVVGFTRGDAGLAVQAASAIEGQFTPVRIRGVRYADADQRMPLPVRLARELGAQRVLAVDASAHEDRAPAGAERYREVDLRKRALTLPDSRAADVLLHPEFGYWVNTSRAFRERAIEAGYRAAQAQAPRLQALHQAT